MTQLEALRQAQETGQIAITQQTVNILKSLAEFDQAATNLITAIENGLPDSDSQANDGIINDEVINDFYRLLSPLQDYVYSKVGVIVLQGVFLYQCRNFEGL